MKISKSKRNNIIFLGIILLLIIPQTRTPIQVALHKGLSYILKPSVIDINERETLSNYNWKLKNQSGKIFDFNAAKEKVIVINFWATWCPPCIAEMSSLQKLYDVYSSNQEIVFLYVSNESKEVISKFKTKNKFTFEVYNPITDYPKIFDVTSIPRTFIINKKGEIVIDESGASDWNSDKIHQVIDRLLSE